ncbi:MAG: hypothetical protein JRN52_11180 [Nitrososphaerota archaeon]|nr:hypothetical protein [Nitrososphaerota archaeon]
MSEARAEMRIRAQPHRDPRPLACLQQWLRKEPLSEASEVMTLSSDGDGVSSRVDANSGSGTKSFLQDRRSESTLAFEEYARGTGTKTKGVLWVHRRA